MTDASFRAHRPGDRRARGGWSRWTAASAGTPVILVAMLILAVAVGGRRHAARAQAPALTGTPEQASQRAQPVNYRIRGDATVVFDYSSEAGQKELADCHVSVLPKWHLVLEGTLDSVGQTLTGTFQFTGLDLDRWEEWDSALLQCGPEMHGMTSCSAGCGPNWVQYRYSGYTGFGSSTFRGTYDSEGNITILGSTSFGARYLFQDCFNGITGEGIPCERALGFAPQPVPPDVRAPRNASYALGNFGVREVVITGKLVFTDDFGGVSIRGNMNLPSSEFAECCIVSDPLFLSDKNVVRITGEAVLPGRE
jgi:hypothetical protein